ncbi:MAG: orotate phosphoribosyltransferase [Deltaproteobacteria bacterium]|nr:orotate phosphoribosyltransferase [Deltaproteobacteria bacterium]
MTAPRIDTDSPTRRNADLAQILVHRSYLEAEREEDYFVLTSGRRSKTYFDCQVTTAYAQAMPLIGRAFLDEFSRHGVAPDAVGGLTRGADPVAQAIVYTSLLFPPVVQLFSVRKARKEHGMRRWIEGCAPPGGRVAVVDDVVTSGKSVLQAIAACREEGLEVAQVVVLVDREEGGMDRIRELAGKAPVTAIFTRSELEALR